MPLPILRCVCHENSDFLDIEHTTISNYQVQKDICQNILFEFCARNIPYLHTVPFGPNWPDDADTHKVLGRSTSRTLHGMRTATAARIPQRGSAPSAPVHCRTERARPTDPLSLRADDHDDVGTRRASIESATITRKMAGRAVKNLRQTHRIK